MTSGGQTWRQSGDQSVGPANTKRRIYKVDLIKLGRGASDKDSVDRDLMPLEGGGGGSLQGLR